MKNQKKTYFSKTHFFLLEILIEKISIRTKFKMEVKEMYGYLKQKKNEGKLTKSEETKLACIQDKIGKLYGSYHVRMKKTTEKETKKQVREKINALSIEQKAKLLSLLDSVEEAVTENPETTLINELEEA